MGTHAMSRNILKGEMEEFGGGIDEGKADGNESVD